MEAFVWMEMAGVAAFAFSGAQVAIHRRMDVFGVLTLGVVTALGGGILRDGLILNVTPACLSQPHHFAIAAAVCLLACLRRRSLPTLAWALFDAIGLGAFVVSIGAKLYAQGHPPGVFLLGSLLTAVGGGMLRDLLARRIPVVLRRDIYALAGLGGAGLLWGLLRAGLHELLAMGLSLLAVVGLRMASAAYALHLPVPGASEPLASEDTVSFPPVRANGATAARENRGGANKNMVDSDATNLNNGNNSGNRPRGRGGRRSRPRARGGNQ